MAAGMSAAGANKLTELQLLARSARGASAVAIVRQATEHPALFAFGEILAAPGVAELAGTPNQGWLELLRIYAYGTYMDYSARADALPQLSPAQLTKLRMLTVVSLSYYNKNLPYDTLIKHLALTSLRSLEDLILEAIYAGVIRAKLNQKDRTLEVESSIGRDVRPSDVPGMVALLSQWHRQSSELVTTLDARMVEIGRTLQAAEKSRADFDATIDAVRQRLSKRGPAGGESERRGGDYSSQEYFDEDSRSRGKGRHKIARSSAGASSASNSGSGPSAGGAGGSGTTTTSGRRSARH